MNVFDDFNARIAEFVGKDENEVLRRGTGTFCTPFRGTLFGLERSSDVAAALPNRQVDVLWLGANPNVQASVDAIFGRPHRSFPPFRRQVGSGFYGEVHPDYADARVGWDPIGQPQRGWRFYMEVFSSFANRASIAMANVIPWGSSDAKEFWGPLGKEHAELVDRLVTFSDELNEDITAALRPRLIVVPRSLGERTGLAMSRADVRPVPVATSRTFNFHVGRVSRKGRWWNVAYLPHPAAIRYSAKDRVVIADALRTELSSLIERP